MVTVTVADENGHIDELWTYDNMSQGWQTFSLRIADYRRQNKSIFDKRYLVTLKSGDEVVEQEWTRSDNSWLFR